MPAIAKPPLHRWTYAEWDRMVASGSLDGQRVELIAGEVVEMSPQCEPHVLAISFTANILRIIFPEPAFWVRVQSPLRLGRSSDPEPDIAVVPGPPRDYLKSGHPHKAILVVEVADSSLDYDRDDKASLYASAGVADYWILNLLQRQCEVHRNPIADPAERFGFRYHQITVHKPGDSIAPLGALNSPVAISEMLP